MTYLQTTTLAGLEYVSPTKVNTVSDFHAPAFGILIDDHTITDKYIGADS